MYILTTIKVHTSINFLKSTHNFVITSTQLPHKIQCIKLRYLQSAKEKVQSQQSALWSTFISEEVNQVKQYSIES